jgi:hypothetical protein
MNTSVTPTAVKVEGQPIFLLCHKR